jgi:predicted nucleic acid-binding protein
MTFDAIAAGQSVFVDANVFLHYFTMHSRYGPACQKLLDRIENHEITGFTSASVLTEVVHRLMTIEACQRFGWPVKGIARRLRRHRAEVQQLTRSRQAIDEITLCSIVEEVALESNQACEQNHAGGGGNSTTAAVAVRS